jgi:hypothetical protein
MKLRLSMLAGLGLAYVCLAQQPAPRAMPYRELEGTVEEFKYYREWRSYYWREDFTMLVRDAAGKVHRVISREPTPWTDLRLGTTYPGLTVDWSKHPRVKIVGVQAIDRIPVEFYELKLDPQATITAFIARVDVSGKADGKPEWKDYFVNNWFHKWGADTDKKILAHYATDDPNYTVYGYLGGIAAPFDAEGKALVDKNVAEYPGTIYHGRIVKADNDVGYAVHVLHLMGRSKKTADYNVYYGDPKQIVKLDQKAPPKK